MAIRIAKSFHDCARKEFAAGTILHFTYRNYLPYHSAHTAYFREASSELSEMHRKAGFDEATAHPVPKSPHTVVLATS